MRKDIVIHYFFLMELNICNYYYKQVIYIFNDIYYNDI